jgi:hypothetical protein
MNESRVVGCDGACVCIFDPEVIKNYEGNDKDSYDYQTIEGIQSGIFSGFKLGADGGYKILISDKEISGINKVYATKNISRLGIKVTSGEFYISGGCFEADKEFLSDPIHMENGEYDISIYQVCWHFSVDEESLKNNEDVTDFYIELKKRSEPFKLSTDDLTLDTIYIPSIPDRELCSAPFFFPNEVRDLKEDYQPHSFSEEEF